MTETISTKGYPIELIEKVAQQIMTGGYANERAIDIIEIVANWSKNDLHKV
jgi:hypothetical protein